MAERELRILDFCAANAHKIVAELRTAGGDYSDHISTLHGLIDEWESLQEQVGTEGMGA